MNNSSEKADDLPNLMQKELMRLVKGKLVDEADSAEFIGFICNHFAFNNIKSIHSKQ